MAAIEIVTSINSRINRIILITILSPAKFKYLYKYFYYDTYKVFLIKIFILFKTKRNIKLKKKTKHL